MPFLPQALSSWCAVVLMVLGALALGLYSPLRRDEHLRWYGLAAIAGALFLAPQWTGGGAWPEPLARLLWATSAVLAVHFLMAFIGKPMRRWRWGLWMQALGLWVLPSLLTTKDAPELIALLSAALLLQVMLALVLSLWACMPERMADTQVLAAGLGLMLGIWLVSGVAGQLQYPVSVAPLSWLAATFSHPVAWLAPFVLLGVRLILRFKHELLSAEASLARVQTQFMDVTGQVERNFAQLSEMRVQQVTEQERKRIAADLHDDLGAKLLTIVHTCENERIAALGREALDEMRLSVRGLSGRPMQLGDAMADWRAETVQRLSQANIQTEWHALPEDVEHLLPARAYVQTTRIVREAVSNIIKHSGASLCEVRCFATGEHYGLVVEDNGRGMTTASDGALDRGHGLSSMKHRAKQLHGQCLVESDIGRGTVIRLSLPF